MKKFLTLAAIASGLFLVSCTADTDTIEPAQNLNVNQNFEESAYLKTGDSLTEGEPYIKKDKD